MYMGLALFLLLVFSVTALLTFAVIDFLLKIRVDSRLDVIRDQSNQDFREIPVGFERRARKILDALNRFSMPKEDSAVSPIRLRFIRAGYKGDVPVLLYFSSKTLLTFLLPLAFLVYVYFTDQVFGFAKTAFFGVALAGLGYYLPDFYLNQRARGRQREIFEGFPDALDLMRVCVGAGLGLDAAIARVGKELEIKSVALAEEFRELNLQLRAGMSRQEALRNLAKRTGVEDVNSLVSMLIQSARFGTSSESSGKCRHRKRLPRSRSN